MKTSKKNNEVNEMREEYDFSGGVREKHFEAYRKGHPVEIGKPDGTVEGDYFTQEDGAVLLEPDVKSIPPIPNL